MSPDLRHPHPEAKKHDRDGQRPENAGTVTGYLNDVPYEFMLTLELGQDDAMRTYLWYQIRDDLYYLPWHEQEAATLPEAVDLFDFREGEAVEMWTTRRLPYIDRQTAGERIALERLRRALRQMPDDQTSILSARYTSTEDGTFDIENVLAYNIGMAAFCGAARRGMVFERVRGVPPNAPSGFAYRHHHAYELVPAPVRPVYGTTVSFELPSVNDVDQVWWAVASSPSVAHTAVTGRFALYVEVGMPGRTSLQSSQKKIVDGIVAGLQADPSPDAEAVRRLALRMSLPEDQVRTRLSAPSNGVLGQRSQLLFVRGRSVQWNPGDDKCEAVTVIAIQTPGVCSVTIVGCSRA